LAPRLDVSLASDSDMAVVHRHFNPGSPQRDQSPNPNVMNWVAKRGSKIVGFVQYVRHPDSFLEWGGHWLFSLEVWRQYRGMGLGETLTNTVIGHAAAQGALDLWLVVKEDNNRAIRLYQKLGFEITLRPALEPKLEAEKRLSGRRRIAMRKSLKVNP
jgi:ribosomal protein S18 acetylase RimI-like enzyme